MTSISTINKPFWIEKRRVYEAYKVVKSNHGAAGVDGQTLEAFEKDLAGNHLGSSLKRVGKTDFWVRVGSDGF